MQEPRGWLLFGEGRPRHRSDDRMLLGAGGTKTFVAPGRVDNRFGVVHPSAVRGVKLPRLINCGRFPGSGPSRRAEVHRIIYDELCLGVLREKSRQA